VQPDATAAPASYTTAHGIVQSVNGSHASVRTGDGRVMTVDVASLPRTAHVTANESVMVVYDQATRTALWVQPDTAATTSTTNPAQPSASVPTGSTGSTRLPAPARIRAGDRRVLPDPEGRRQMSGTAFHADVVQKQ
jgi:hypothetical protein